jgi:hypothetical protein
MRINEILPQQGVRELIDICHSAVDLRRHLRLPDQVQYRRHGLGDADTLDLAADSVVLSLLGPNQPGQTDPDQLGPVLRRFRLGTRGVLLLGWSLEQLPYHRLLGPLVTHHCQVVEAMPVDLLSIRGVRAALVIECVDHLAPIAPYLADGTRTAGRADQPSPEPADELRTALRMANEFVLSDLVSRTLRRQLSDLTGQVEQLKRTLTQAEARIAHLESPTRARLARAIVNGLRHPGRTAARLPQRLVRIWRTGESSPRPGTPTIAGPAPQPPHQPAAAPMVHSAGQPEHRSAVT